MRKTTLLLMISVVAILSFVFLAPVFVAEPAQFDLQSQMSSLRAAAYPADLASVPSQEVAYLMTTVDSGMDAATSVQMYIAENDGSAFTNTSTPYGILRYPLKTQIDVITGRHNYTLNVERATGDHIGSGSRRYPLKYPSRALGGAV